MPDSLQDEFVNVKLPRATAEYYAMQTARFPSPFNDLCQACSEALQEPSGVVRLEGHEVVVSEISPAMFSTNQFEPYLTFGCPGLRAADHPELCGPVAITITPLESGEGR